MGVVITHGFTDNFRAFNVLAVGHYAQVVHGVKDTPLGRFEAIAHIRQGS